ncbi:phospholipase A2 inhibitor NAI-like [Heteronotia binoei]|uniref:phospholipase A2 inhibitor NAI-like n=1 Tax=Heteronotia binoei TaxID=13085 RepID=UPI0029315D98|nr:phospholipase A2 inhibitor NAI-like [Heteronotia binoei]
MQSFLPTCLLATFIATGESLSCEHCFSVGPTCKGPFGECSSDTDTCGIIQLRSSGVFEEEAIGKACLHSKLCNNPIRYLDFGIMQQILVKTTCCVGEECEVIPPLPPINAIPNGNKCPACYSMRKRDCKGVVVECTGDNTYCTELMVDKSFGHLNISFVLKGCTNYDVCNDEFLGSSDLITLERCVASSGTSIAFPGSGPPTAFLGSPPLFLQTFSGLLLLKIFL